MKLDSLTVVKVTGHAKWAEKAVYGKEIRYHTYYYKAEAIKGLEEWSYYPDMCRSK